MFAPSHKIDDGEGFGIADQVIDSHIEKPGDLVEAYQVRGGCAGSPPRHGWNGDVKPKRDILLRQALRGDNGGRD